MLPVLRVAHYLHVPATRSGEAGGVLDVTTASTVLAIDPGPALSAYVWWDGFEILGLGKVPNEDLLGLMRCDLKDRTLAIEMIASYGMPVGASVFETCVWIGRFVEAWGGDFQYVTRRAVKLHLCNSAKAKDSNVSQALRDRFGWTRSEARKLGLKADVWQALGVAVCWYDTLRDPSA